MAGAGELKEIKKEIIEARGLIIKSNNLANSLSAEVRGIAKRQASYERHLSWNSTVFFILFAVAVFVAGQLYYNYRQASLAESMEAAKERAATAEKELALLKSEHRSDNTTRDEDLLALYELIHDRLRQEAIDAFDKLDQDQLTPFELKLAKESIDGFRSDLSMQHYLGGLELVSDEKYAEAVEEFRTSLRFKGDVGHATAAKIEMANALRLQGKPREAIAVLQRLMEEHLDRSLSDDAYWYLALSHYEAHQRDEARSVLRALMRQFPDSQYYRAARLRANEIQAHLYSSGN